MPDNLDNKGVFSAIADDIPSGCDYGMAIPILQRFTEMHRLVMVNFIAWYIFLQVPYNEFVIKN